MGSYIAPLSLQNEIHVLQLFKSIVLEQVNRPLLFSHLIVLS
jgi:hypothetical protein